MYTRNKTSIPILPFVISLAMLVALCWSLAGRPAQRAQAAGFTVTKTADTADGACDSDCSLREAILAANATGEADTILLGPGSFVLTRSGADNTASLGDLDVTHPLIITGQGRDLTIIDANGLDRVFEILSNAGTVVLSDLTVTGGSSASFCGGISATGGVDLQLVNVVVRDNQAVTVGGGICASAGTALLQNSRISENTAGTKGGGIYVGNAQVTFQASEILSNTAGSTGGGMYVDLEDSLVTGTGPGAISFNQACDGGGVYLSEGDASLEGIDLIANDTGACGHGGAAYAYAETASFTLESASISQNQGEDGAGVYIHNGAATLEQVAVTDNQADNIGGGIYNGYGNLSLTNVTVSGNSALVNSSLGGGGGGLFLGGSTIYSSQTEMLFVTVANNTSETGFGGTPGAGGIQFTHGDLDLQNTIIANNANQVEASNCMGANQGISLVTSYGNNLESADTCGLTESSDQIDANPLLNALTSEGVHPLQPNSPAIDAGVCLPGIDFDQRGAARPQGSGCDEGAYEAAETPPQGLTGVSIDGPHTGVTDTAYTFTATASPPDASLPITYTWSPAPASGQGTASVTYQWAAAGAKQLSVTAQNKVNNVSSDIFSIEISEAPLPEAQIYLPLIMR